MNSAATATEGFSRKKAFEISYVLLRISARLKSRGFAEQLENQAANLLAAVIQKDCQKSEDVLSTIEYLVRLGSEIGFIHPENSQLIINEARALKPLVVKREDKPVNLEDINTIFGGTGDNPEVSSEIMPKSSEMSPEINKKSSEVKEKTLENKDKSPEMSPEMSPENEEISSEERQTMILAKIREAGDCRINDIHCIFPGLSDRAIRYDLQALAERGIIEKIGSFGPTVYYRIKNNKITGLPIIVEDKV